MKRTLLCKCLLATLLLFVGFTFSQCSKSKVTDTIAQAQLDIIEKAMNAQCPMQVDEYTVLDNCESLDNKTLRYNYTVTDFESLNVSTEDFSANVKSIMIETIKTNSGLETLRNLSVSFESKYNDPKGDEICIVKIEPADYK